MEMPKFPFFRYKNSRNIFSILISESLPAIVCVFKHFCLYLFMKYESALKTDSAGRPTECGAFCVISTPDLSGGEILYTQKNNRFLACLVVDRSSRCRWDSFK